MAGNDGRLNFSATFDTKEVTRGVENLKRQFAETGNSADMLNGKLAKLAAGFFTLQKAWDLSNKIAHTRGEFQQLEIAFSTMLQSIEKGTKLMDEMVDLAAKTPFGLSDVSNGAKQLLAYGSTAENVRDELVMLGDIASGLSLPLNDIVYLYGTTRTQGRLFTQDLRQFMGRGIPLAEELAKQFGVAKDKVGDLVTAGRVGFEDVRQALVSMTSEGGKFAGLMEKQSASITGQISNLEDAVDTMMNNIGKALEEPIGAALDVASKLVENYEQVGKVIAGLVAVVGSYKAAVILVNTVEKLSLAQKTILIASYKALRAQNDALTAAQVRQVIANSAATISFKALAAAVKTATMAMLTNPYVLATAAIAGLAAGVYVLATAKSDEEIATERVNEATEKQTKSYDEATEAAKEYVEALHDQEKSEEELITLYQSLPEKSQRMIDMYGKERLAAMSLTEAINALADARDLGESSDYLDKYSEAIDRAVRNSRKAEKNGNSPMITYYSSAAAKAEAEAEEYLRLAEEARNRYNKRHQQDGGKSTEAEAEAKKDKSYWEQVKKNAEGELEALEVSELSSKKAIDLRKKIQEATAKIKLYDADGKEADKAAKALEARSNYLQKKGNEYAKAAREIEIQASDAAIEGMEEGYEKEKAALDRRHEQELADIEAWLAAQKAEISKQKLSQDEKNTLSKTAETIAAGRTANENSSYDAKVAKLEKQAQDERIKNQNSYLRQYGTYREKEAAITDEYNRAVEKSNDEFEKKLLAAARDEALYELKKQYSGIYALIFESAESMSNSQLARAIEYTQEEIKKASNSGNIERLTDLYDKLNEKMSEMRSREGSWGFGAIAEGFRKLQDADTSDWLASTMSQAGADEFAKMWMEQGLQEREEGIAQLHNGLEQLLKVSSELGDALESFGGTLGEIGGFFSGLASSSQDVAGTLTQAFSGTLSKSSAISTAISGTLELVGMIGSSIAANKKAQEDWNATVKQCAHEYAMLELESLDYEQRNIFGVENPYSKALASAKQYQAAMDKLNESQAALTGGQVQTGTKRAVDWQKVGKGAATGVAAGAAVGSLFGPMGTAIGAAAGALTGALAGFFSTKRVAVYESLADKYDYIVDKQNKINPKIIADYDKMDDETKQLIDNWEEIVAKAEEAEKQLEESITQLVGDIGTQLTDALEGAFLNGNVYDAIDDFEAYIKKMIENIALQAFVASIYGDIFDEFEKMTKASMGEGGDGSIIDDLMWLLDAVEGRSEMAEEEREKLVQLLKEHGIENPFSSDSTRTAASKGIAQASQDSVNELNGRFTVIQSHTFTINENVAAIRDMNTMTANKVSDILIVLSGVHGDTSAMRSEIERIKRYVEDIKDKGVKVSMSD